MIITIINIAQLRKLLIYLPARFARVFSYMYGYFLINDKNKIMCDRTHLLVNLIQ